MEKWLVLGEDARMRELAKYLDSQHRTVFFKQTKKWDSTVNAIVLDFAPTHIVLPILPLEIDVPLLLGVKHVTFFAGKLTDEWHGVLKKQKLVLYLENETFIWRNAALTTESFIKWWYEQGENLAGKSFIVTGFGRLAKNLARSLTALGANVTIAVRSRASIEDARVAGYDAISLDLKQMKQTTALINTIPAQWLTPSLSEGIHMPIYDLASAPGCLYYVSRQDYEALIGLPGKHFPQAAAKLLQQSITEGCE